MLAKESFASHLKIDHQCATISRPEILAVKAELKQFEDEHHVSLGFPEPPRQETKVPPWGGLQIFNGRQCAYCPFVSPDLTVLKRHIKSQHSSSPYQSSPCQMQRTHAKFWFAIDPPLPGAELPPMLEAIAQLASPVLEQLHAPLLPFQPMGPRDVSPWLQNTKWHTHTEGHSVAELTHLARYPTANLTLKSTVQSYFHQAVQWLDGATDRLVLQRLNTDNLKL